MNSIGPLKRLRVRVRVSRMQLDFVAIENPELLWPRRNDNRIDLKIYDASSKARRCVIKTKKTFVEDKNFEQFVEPEVFSSAYSHAHYNVKLSILTSLEQQQ